MPKNQLLGILAALMLVLNACGKKEEARTIPAPAPAPTQTPAPASVGVTVQSIAVGSAIGADKKVTRAADSFGSKDTIYATIDTTGSGTATLRAKWTYLKNGQEILVKEDKQTIAPTGPASNEFHISKPDGWPAGDYQVEIFVGDKPAGTKTFTVK